MQVNEYMYIFQAYNTYIYIYSANGKMFYVLLYILI